jgi:hypothetical protein
MDPDKELTERSARRPVSLRAKLTRRGGKTFGITLLDLSSDGCGFETPVELTAGEQVTISVDGQGALGARVCWSRDGHAGLVFNPEKPASQRAERAAERIPVGVDITLRRVGGTNYRVRVNDLSPEGCRVELVERPAVGDIMHLKFDGLDVLEAEVCWVDGFTAGLRFEKPIHPAVFDLLMRRIGR